MIVLRRAGRPLGMIFALVTFIGGCSSGGQTGARLRNPGLCPNILVLADAARLIEFEGDTRAENVAYTAEILDVSTSCRYFDARPIEADVTMTIAVGRGPKATGEDRKNITYFASVTRKDKDLIAKKEFTVPVKFGREAQTVITQNIDNIVIPRKGAHVSGDNFEIVVGLALTKSQVIYNRSGESLKFPNL